MLSLPLYTRMTQGDVERVAQALRQTLLPAPSSTGHLSQGQGA